MALPSAHFCTITHKIIILINLTITLIIQNVCTGYLSIHNNIKKSIQEEQVIFRQKRDTKARESMNRMRNKFIALLFTRYFQILFIKRLRWEDGDDMGIQNCPCVGELQKQHSGFRMSQARTSRVTIITQL